MTKSVRSQAEERLAEALAAAPLPGWDLVREYRFHPTRRWRFDFAFPSQKLGIEVDGRGYHQTHQGVRNDCVKFNEAARLGWRVLRFPGTDKAKAAEWAALIVEILCSEGTANPCVPPELAHSLVQGQEASLSGLRRGRATV
jgi:very-short-patch-repair endonuclease